MKGITLEQIEQKLKLNKDQPRKLKHWQVKHADYKRKTDKAKAKADAFETLRLKNKESI